MNIYLVDVACENPTYFDPPPVESNIADPASYISDFLRFLATSGSLITRTGTERAADILFTHPDVSTFFRNPDNITALRDTIHQDILPAASQIFRDHWNYIIGPAMDEHIAVAVLTTPTEPLTQGGR
jgi:hypothetical protein